MNSVPSLPADLVAKAVPAAAKAGRVEKVVPVRAEKAALRAVLKKADPADPADRKAPAANVPCLRSSRRST